MDDLRRIDKQLADLELEWLSRQISKTQHRRRYTALMAERERMTGAGQRVIDNDLWTYKYTTVTDTTAGTLTREDFERAVQRMTAAKDEMIRQQALAGAVSTADWARGLMNDYAYFSPPPLRENSVAAEAIWRERNGTIVCECDNADCFAVLNISHAEYLSASGPGQYYRVTHPACHSGVLGSTLIQRSERWWVWAK